MKTYIFPVNAHEEKGDSNSWEIEFEVTDEEEELLKQYAADFPLSACAQLEDLDERIWNQVIEDQIDVYESEDECKRLVAENTNKTVADVTRDDIRDYLLQVFWFVVHFPEELIPEDEDREELYVNGFDDERFTMRSGEMDHIQLPEESI